MFHILLFNIFTIAIINNISVELNVKLKRIMSKQFSTKIIPNAKNDKIRVIVDAKYNKSNTINLFIIIQIL